MTQEEIIQAISDDKTMPFIQPEQLAGIVDFVIKNYNSSLDTLPDSEWTEKDKENWASALGTIYGAGLYLNDDDFVRNNELKKQAEWLESLPRKFGLMYHKVRVKETGECLWAEYSSEAAEYYALFSERTFSPEEIEFVNSIPEQPTSEEKFRNLLDAMGDCGFSQDNILLLKSIWEDAGCQIQQQEQPDAYEDAMLEVKEYVDKLYDNASIGLNEYDSGLYNGIAETCMKLRGFIKARISREQPELELTEEVKRYYSDNFAYISSDQPTLSILTNVARQFYELGCRRTAEMYDDIEHERQRAEEAEITNNLEEEISRYLREECAGDDEPSVSDIARHFAEWGAEHLKR